MNTFLLVLLLVIFLVVFFKFKKTSRGSSSAPGADLPPYYSKVPVSEVEQVLFHRLKEEFPGFVVLAQVSMVALLGIRKNPNWNRQFNEISRKYVDFVLCRPDFSVAVVVELDDSSHQRGERIRADSVKDSAFFLAGVPVVRFDVREMPDRAALRLALGSYVV
jgi:hypothetical protein